MTAEREQSDPASSSERKSGTKLDHITSWPSLLFPWMNTCEGGGEEEHRFGVELAAMPSEGTLSQDLVAAAPFLVTSHQGRALHGHKG